MIWGYCIYKENSGDEKYCKYIDTSFNKYIYYEKRANKDRGVNRYCYNKFIRNKFNKEY